MEKALLNVTRFNSADVIATSGETKTCGHTLHIKVMSGPDEHMSYTGIQWDYVNGQWVEDPEVDWDMCEDDYSGSLAIGHFYYVDDNGKYQLCN